VPQFASAFGHRRQHCVPVGDGFIAGRLDATGEVFRREYGLFFHGVILACRVPPPHSSHGKSAPRGTGRLALRARAKCIEIVTVRKDSFLMERWLKTLKHDGRSLRIMSVGEKSCQRVAAFTK